MTSGTHSSWTFVAMFASLIMLILFLVHTFPSDAVQTDAVLANDFTQYTPSHINDASKVVLWELDRENDTRMYTRYPGGIIRPQALGDLNGDGTLDMVMFNLWESGYEYERSLQAIDGATGNLLWKVTDHISTEFPGGWLSPVVIDYDADGVVEVFYSENGGWLNILEGSTGRELRDVFVGSIGTMPKFLDVDNDGVMDIIVGSISFEPNPTLTCLNGRTFFPIWSYKGNFSVGLDPAIGDLDGDGYLDVVIRSGGGGGWGGIPWPWPDWKWAFGDHVIAINTSSGEVMWDRRLPHSYSRYHVPIVCDLNNDGIMEVIVTNDSEWNERPLLTILDGATGSVLEEFKFRNHEDERVSVDGNTLVGDWDGDGYPEVFLPYSFRHRDETWETFVLLYTKGETRQFKYYRNNNALLMDVDGDGLVEYVSDSGVTLYINAGEREPTLLLSDRMIAMAYDVDGDGLVELLIEDEDTLMLLSANEPEVSVSVEGLRGNGVAFPESLSYNVSALVKFPDCGQVLDEVILEMGNGTYDMTISFSREGRSVVTSDGLGGSIEFEGGGVVHRTGTREYILWVVISFNWDYPIDGDSRVSVHVHHGGVFESSFVDLMRYRVEKGINIIGVPEFADANGEGLPSGNWTLSGASLRLSGLVVVHRGAEDIPVPRIFGMGLSCDGTSLLSVARGSMDGFVVLDFNAPRVMGGVNTFVLKLALEDVISGASPGPPISFELKVDGENPFIIGGLPKANIVTNDCWYVLSINMSDGDGSGIDMDSVRFRLKHENGMDTWINPIVSNRLDGGVHLTARIPLDEDGEYFIHWLVPDLVGNRGGPMEIMVLRDTIPPRVHLVDGREWYNSTIIDLTYDIEDEFALNNGSLLIIRTDGGTHVEYFVVSSSKHDALWEISLDLKEDGRYHITIEVTDLAGNVAHLLCSVGVDTEPPTMVLSIPDIMNATGGNVDFWVRVDDGDGSGFLNSVLEYSILPADGDWVRYHVLGDVSSEDIHVWLDLETDTSILLRITDSAGNELISNLERLNLNEPPIPIITAPLNGSELQDGRGVLLDGSASTDPDFQVLTYSWILDGVVISGNNPIVHVDIGRGSHTLSLVVSDGHHTVESSPILFTVSDQRPTPSKDLPFIWVIFLIAMLAIAVTGVVHLSRRKE